MDLKKMMPVLVLALAGLATACGDKCKSACEDEKKCSTADAATKAQDCTKVCDDASSKADTYGCSSEYDDVVSCVSDLDDVCKFDQTKDCTSETAKYGACAIKYCTAHSTDAACK